MVGEMTMNEQFPGMQYLIPLFYQMNQSNMIDETFLIIIVAYR